MHSTPKPKQADDPHDIVVVAADAVAVAPADEELSNLLHDAARRLSQAQARAASDVPAGAAIPQVDTTFRPAAVNDVLAPGRLRSIGRGAMRAFAAVLLATGIGVVGIGWESYGDAAQQMIALTSSLPPEKPALSAQPAPPVVQAEAANPAPPQPLPPAQTAAPGVAPSAAAESAQLLQSMARDLATVGQEIGQLKASIEQLKASQQQISRDIAKASEAKASETKASEIKASEAKASEMKASETKASEQSLRPRIAAPLPRPAAAPARRPMPPPPPLAAAAPTSPQAEPPPQAAAQPQAQELSSVPRPPMPLTPGIGSFSQQ